MRQILTLLPLRRLHDDRSGTAMTEFAITLPVYVMFMVGIISMFEIHQGVILSEQRAAANLWDDAVDAQYREYIPSWQELPDPAAGRAANWYSQADDANSPAAAIDVLDSALGTYFDSGTKVGFADGVGATNLDMDCPDGPRMSIGEIVDPDSHTARLMNDMNDFSNVGGSSGPVMIASAILDGTGSRPFLGAGIRYGIVGGIDEAEFGSDHDLYSRAYGAETLTAYNASRPTRPMERIFQLALVRLEMGTESAYDDTVAFGWSNRGDGIDDIDLCP